LGFNLAWLAVQGRPKTDVLKSLQLRDTGTGDSYLESDYSGAALRGGWYVVVNRQFDLWDDPYPRAASANSRLIAAAMLEGSMMSAASEWRNGRQIWLVEYDGQNGAGGPLNTTGSMPPEYASIRTQLLAKQRNSPNVDFTFDVPIELAAAITGFRPDRMPLILGPKFTELRRL
jgi:hypothetical protein